MNKPQPNWQGAENNQQRTGSESYQQRTSSENSTSNRSSEASSYNRSGETGSERSSGGFDRSSGGSGSENLDREAQNRSRGDFSSQRFQNFQRGGGGGDFGGNRFGGGGGFGGDRFGVVAASAAAALADSEVGAAGADGNNLGLELTFNFSTTKTQPTQLKENL